MAQNSGMKGGGGDDKRFWLGRLVDINDKTSNESTSLNPEFFAERFELNDDYFKQASCFI